MRLLFFLLIVPFIISITVAYDGDYNSIRQSLIDKYRYSKLLTDKTKIFYSNQKLNSNNKVLALTFDACKGEYNKDLIDYLIDNNIPATLFISGKWIDSNKDAFISISKCHLFEIENHGLEHRSLVISRKYIYNVASVASVSEMIDEIELNANKIQDLTGHKPVFFRSATGFYSKLSVQIIRELGYSIANGNSAAFDYNGNVTAEEMFHNVLKTESPSIVVFHMNHPEWNELGGIKLVVNHFRSKGYTFVKLSDYGIKQ